MASKSPEESEDAKTQPAMAQYGAKNAKSAAGSTSSKPATTAKTGDAEKKEAGKAEARTAAQARSGATGKQQGPAVAMLMADHRAAEKLFAEYEKAKEARRRAIITAAAHALTLHTMLEEEIFYPACREEFSDEDDLDEAQVEHDGVKLLIADLLHGSPDDPYRDAKFRVLTEYVRHHVREEEEDGGIFSMADKCGIDTPELAREMTERRTQLERGGPLPDPQLRALRGTPGGGMPNSFHRQNPQDSGGEGKARDRSRYIEENEMGSYQQHRGRDDDDYGSRRGGNGGSNNGGGGDRPRDEDGRFTSSNRSSNRGDDDRYGRSDRGGGGGGQQSYRRDDDDHSRSGRGGGGRGDDDRGQGGWFGDARGHSDASRRGWDNPDHGRSGWFGDSEGHSEASRRGWDSPDHGSSGWFGDSEGHSEASHRGWDDRGGSRSNSRDGGRNDDDRGSSRSGRGGGGRDYDDRSQGGWFGDSRGHSEASRRGWESRR